MGLPDAVGARVVSCDVFDTLLHRDHRSESRRFRDIAALAAHRLAREKSIVRDPAAIWRARIEVQRHAYRALELVRPEGDVRFADLIEAIGQILDLDSDAAQILHEAEIAIERRQLSANGPLLAWLGHQVEAGARVIAVSDTYHPSATITHLLDALAPGHPVSRVHTSADHDATKKSGALFARVLRAEGLTAGDVLHIGDDERADIAMGRAAGLRTVRVVRPRHVVLRRKADALRSRLLWTFGTSRRATGPLRSPA